MREKIKVLLFEDDPGDTQIIEEFLSDDKAKEFDLIPVSSLAEGTNILKKNLVNAVLFNLSLFDNNMSNSLMKMRVRFSEIPFILLTDFGKIDPSIMNGIDINMIQSGYCNYLYKHRLNSSLLVNTIRHAIKQQNLYNDYKEKQSELESSELRFRTIIEKNADGIVIVDKKGIINYINPTGEKLLGEKLKDIIGTLFNYSVPAYGTSEIRLEQDCGTVVLEMQAVEIPWEGKPSFLLTLRDITERKRMEENLKETLEKLERSNKDLEQFAYAVSHDLCEPLRSISGFIQLLARRYKGSLDENADRFISRSMTAAARMQEMITSILEYSRLNSPDNEFTAIDCNEVLNHVIANLEGAIDESKTKITHDHLPIVSANFLQMLRVFQNLIANAIKFHGEKRPEIHVGVKRENDNYQFSISDNGIGIDPKYSELIFVIFQRLHNRQEYPGSGAGLAICKKIVERHGGTIWIESKPEKGSTFYFTIPIKNEEKNNGKKYF